MKKHIPNIITLGNLFCGSVAVIFAVKGDFYTTALLVLAGVLFDFLDGLVARLLKVQGELGKQLDSLADMVTSGVLPGIVMFKLIEKSLQDIDAIGYFGMQDYQTTSSYLPYLGFLLTLGAGYRLAKFNIDTRQTSSFIGLPTPAMNLFIISLSLIPEFSKANFFINLIANQWFLIAITILFTLLMNVELPLFSLKMKSFSIKENFAKYLFLVLSLVVLAVFKVVGLPMVILLYIIISVIDNILTKKQVSN